MKRQQTVTRVLVLTAALGIMLTMRGKDPFPGEGTFRLERPQSSAGGRVGTEQASEHLAYANPPTTSVPRQESEFGPPVVVVVSGGNGWAPGYVVVMSKVWGRAETSGSFSCPSNRMCSAIPVAAAVDY